MKNINPFVAVVIVVIVALVVIAIMYKATTKPSSGSIQQMTPAERASFYKAYGPTSRPGAPNAPGARPNPGSR